jgi:hypothetical protein
VAAATAIVALAALAAVAAGWIFHATSLDGRLQEAVNRWAGCETALTEERASRERHRARADAAEAALRREKDARREEAAGHAATLAGLARRHKEAADQKAGVLALAVARGEKLQAELERAQLGEGRATAAHAETEALADSWKHEAQCQAGLAAWHALRTGKLAVLAQAWLAELLFWRDSLGLAGGMLKHAWKAGDLDGRPFREKAASACAWAHEPPPRPPQGPVVHVGSEDA